MRVNLTTALSEPPARTTRKMLPEVIAESLRADGEMEMYWTRMLDDSVPPVWLSKVLTEYGHPIGPSAIRDYRRKFKAGQVHPG